MTSLFGTSGIRGPAKTPFTDQFCFDIGRTFAKFLDNHNQVGKIAVGNDPRESSPRIKKFFIEGLLSEDRSVFDEGVTPVSSLNWILIASDFVASTMVTGSHIKADYNGLKFFAFRQEILKEHEAEIEKIYNEIKEKVLVPQKTSEVPQEDKARQLYIKMLTGMIKKPYPLKRMVVDPGNGSQTGVITKVLEETGIEIIPINNSLSNGFLARDTEMERDFEEIKNKVKAEGADLGVGYDADGDRIVFIDESGRFVPPEYACSIIAKYEEGDVVVTPITVSQVVEYTGKRVVRTKVGSPYVVGKMQEVGASFGFEANGGSIFSRYMLTRDGGIPTIKMLNLMRDKSKSMSQLVNEFPKFYIFKDKVECPWELELRVLQEARKNFKGVKTEEVDGLKIWVSPDSWVIFRTSRNSPEFRVFAESKTEDDARNLVENGIKLVKGVIAHGS